MTTDPELHPAFGFRKSPPSWVDAGRDLDEMGVNVGDLGQIGVKLPGTSWMLISGPSFARALAGALKAAADSADDVIAELQARSN
jgi:hypothetical protein